MRIHEIENYDEIEKLLKDDFKINGSYSIDENGYVNVSGNIILEAAYTKLPIKFGKIHGGFSCFINRLKTLENFPLHVDGSVNVSHNDISSLTGAPIFVGMNFRCIGCELTSFIDSPLSVLGGFYAGSNPITSIDGLPKQIGERLVIPFYDDIPVLKLLFIKNLKNIHFDPIIGNSAAIARILNKYVGQGQKGAMQCAAELTKAGFKNNARL